MKYYYTDPLAAAWMAKYFAMEFDAEIPVSYESGYLNYIQDGSYEALSAYQTQVQDRLYIHHNSLHLLDPQVGDYILSDSAIGQFAKKWISQIDNVRDSQVETIGGGIVDKDRFRIIQRNNIPFMWPESS